MRSRAAGIGAAAALLVLAIAPSVSPADAPAQTLAVTVSGSPTGQPIPQSFIGVSMEFQAVHVYTGRDPRNVNPVLVELIRNLAPDQTPVVRIGGNSTDRSWWPVKGVIPPGGVKFRLTKGWMRTTKALAATLGAKLILGVNLAAGRPALAAAEARAFLQGIGRRYIQDIEIGNEPDVYGQFVWYRAPDGRVFFARSHKYSLSQYIHEFSHWRAAIPFVPVAGPALAELTWLSGLPAFISANPSVSLVTVHRYPLRGCINDTSSPTYASIPNLLDDGSAAGLAQSVGPWVTATHNDGKPFRLDEMNSVACSGRKGVSNTFASALWSLDTLFNLASVGVDGVNFHTLPHAGYELFTFKHSGHAWSAFVHPEYYGMLMFTQAAPPGARLLGVSAPAGPVKVWATETTGGQIHVVVINKSTTTPVQVQVSVPGASVGSIETLSAASASATDGVTLGSQSFGKSTTTGVLGAMQTAAASSVLGKYTLNVPAASAVMLTQ